MHVNRDAEDVNFTRTCVVGTDLAESTETFFLVNIGGGVMQYEARVEYTDQTGQTDWLWLTPIKGSVVRLQNDYMMKLEYLNTQNLSVGVHTGKIVIETPHYPSASNAPFEIPVKLEITAE